MKRKQITKIIYFFIFLILLGIGSYILNDNSSKIMTNNQITYLLNTKSKRVHSKDCGVGRRSKDKNKQYRTDSLTSIVKDGYKICGDCNAGIKKSFISSITSKFDDPINVDYDDIVLPTREEYLNAIKEVGEWYVNHIPTYCKTLQEETIEEYNGIEKFIDKVKLKTKDKLFSKEAEYNYLSMNDSSVTIDDLNKNEKVLRANENAIFNYKNNYSKIVAKSGIFQYPCEFLSESIEYKKAGDDCVRYVFTVLNSIDSQFVERIAKTARKSWTKINTDLFNSNDTDFINAMTENKFQIYSSSLVKNDNRINEINNSFELKDGDIICRKGHIHIYIGKHNTDNFGWGRVNRYFPANYSFSIENDGDKYRIKMDKGNSNEYYTKVYRYVGGMR